MVVISPLKIEYGEDRCSLSSVIKDEKNEIEKDVFFSVEKEYGCYLVPEVADSFVLASLLPALVTRQAIKVEAISDHFSDHFKTLVYLLGKCFGYPPIEIVYNRIVHLGFTPQSVATGFSGGVDSFATYLNHSSAECPEEFKITHLTLFNVGSYGNNYATTVSSFMKDAVRAKEFAETVNLPLVIIDSNIGELYTHKDIYHYSLRSTLCLSSAILVLQKLFKIYFISSSGTVDNMKLCRYDQYYYECSLVQLLSNNNTSIYVAEANLDRVQKTKILMNSDLAKKYLYVCAADIYNEKLGTHYQKADKPNCSECIKCTRTLLTLDVLGVLNDFADRFDIDKYKRLKNELLYDVCVNYEYDHFKKEIFMLMKERGYALAPTMKFRLSVGKTILFVRRVSAYLKRKLF